MSSAGAWYSLKMGDGKVVKFQPSKWDEKMQDPTFKQRVYDVMDEEVIQKFDKRLGKAEDFYEEKSE
jgi:hypothetical protein